MMKEDSYKPRKKLSFIRSLLDILNGNFLLNREVTKHIPFLVFLAVLGILYIGNGYLAQHTVIELDKTDKEIEEMRSEFITTRADLENISKPSEITRLIDERKLGLRETASPPYKLQIPETEEQ